MQQQELERLVALDAAASPGHWYVSRFDHEHCMTAIRVEAYVPRKIWSVDVRNHCRDVDPAAALCGSRR
jgi:hypothetical protein